jgi:aspartyl-tRNA synthetase
VCRRKALLPPLQQEDSEGQPRQHRDCAAPAASVDLFWVTDFPLFELADDAALEGGRSHGPPRDDADAAPLPQLQSVHHPFTAPREGEDTAALHAAMQCGAAAVAAAALLPAGAPPPAASRQQHDAWRRVLGIRGQHYDLVCNGVELGGGSIRLHDAATQRGVLEAVLRVTPQQLEGFAPLLAALGSGAPPHGGLALGLDRLVALLVGPECAQSVRDVIAFPKSAAGNDALTGAPAAATPAQWAELHLAPTVAAGAAAGAHVQR